VQGHAGFTRARLTLAIGLASGVLLVGAGGGRGARAGDPAAGARVWQSAGCGACHAFSRAGSGGTSAPSLDRWLQADARRAGLSDALLTFSRVTWGGRGMPAFAGQLTPGQIDDVVSFVVGAPFTAPPDGAPHAPSFDPPPALVTARPATVRRWIAANRLTGAAARGAALFAQAGCLSCHRYASSGQQERGAPELTRIGQKGWSPRRLRDYLAAPYRHGNVLMPAYADLGEQSLMSLAAFLAASRGAH
jgi:mono/diheme cytochrome c family protein